MKFLVDVNASGIVVDWFLERGHDLAEVAEKDPSMGDERILQWAVREQRIIVTTDQDFEQRIWREGKDHRGVSASREPASCREIGSAGRCNGPSQ